METQAPCVDFPVKSTMVLVDSMFLTIAMETSDHLDSIFVLPLHRIVWNSFLSLTMSILSSLL